MVEKRNNVPIGIIESGLGERALMQEQERRIGEYMNLVISGKPSLMTINTNSGVRPLTIEFSTSFK